MKSKNVLPPADVLQRLAIVFDVSIDYLVIGKKSDKVEQTLKDAGLIKHAPIQLFQDRERTA